MSRQAKTDHYIDNTILCYHEESVAGLSLYQQGKRHVEFGKRQGAVRFVRRGVLWVEGEEVSREACAREERKEWLRWCIVFS